MVMRCFQAFKVFVKTGFLRDRLKAVRTISIIETLLFILWFSQENRNAYGVFDHKTVLSQFIGFYVTVGRLVLLILSHGYADCCGAVTCGERLITLHIKSLCRRTYNNIHNRVCVVSDRLRMFMLRTYIHIVKWLMIVERGKGSPAICIYVLQWMKNGSKVSDWLFSRQTKTWHTYNITSLSHQLSRLQADVAFWNTLFICFKRNIWT